MKQIKKLKKWVILCWNNTKKLINHFVYNSKLEVHAIYINFEIKNKVIDLLELIIDTSITGYTIYYCIHYQNFFAYGLISLLGIYYLKKVVSIIKGKENNNKWY